MRKFWIPLAALTVAALSSAALVFATASSDVQANSPQVAGDAGSDTTARFPTNKQNEPSIAVNPTNSSYVVAGANDEQAQPPCGPGPVRGATAARNDCSFFTNVGTDGIYTSSDGGGSWTNRGLLPGFSDYPGDPDRLVSDGDPVLFWGPKPSGGGFSYAGGARAYYGSLAGYNSAAGQGNQAPELLTVSTSDDNGASWSSPAVAATGHGYTFNDKPDFRADANPASPYFGRVYASWTQFRDLREASEPVMFSYSKDGGKTWTRPNQLSIAQNYAFGGRQGSVVRTGPDGTVYVVWEDSDRFGYKHVVEVSRDGGRSFSKPVTIAYVGNISDPIPGANFRTDSFPTAAVDQGTGAVYVAWADTLGGTTGQIVVARSTTGGKSWSSPVPVGTPGTGYAFFQGLDVAPNGRVDVAWQALTAANPSTYGTANASVRSWYSSSGDGGGTWTAPVQVSASSDPAGSAQNNLARQFWGDYNTLVSTDASAWFIYTDARNGAGCALVDAYQHSVDGSGPSAPKPAPEDVCPAQFGNSDAFVSKITP